MAGTAPLDPQGRTVGVGDPEAQVRRSVEIIERALEAMGGHLSGVVRTRIYIADPEIGDRVGEAHRKAFAPNPPVFTMVVVAGLLDPEWLVEIEAEAVVGEGGDDA